MIHPKKSNVFLTLLMVLGLLPFVAGGVMIAFDLQGLNYFMPPEESEVKTAQVEQRMPPEPVEAPSPGTGGEEEIIGTGEDKGRGPASVEESTEESDGNEAVTETSDTSERRTMSEEDLVEAIAVAVSENGGSNGFTSWEVNEWLTLFGGVNSILMGWATFFYRRREHPA